MAVTKQLVVQGHNEIDVDIAGGPLTVEFPDTTNLIHGQSLGIFNIKTTSTTITLEKSSVTTSDKIMDPSNRATLSGTIAGVALANYGFLYYRLDKEHFANTTWVWLNSQ